MAQLESPYLNIPCVTFLTQAIAPLCLTLSPRCVWKRQRPPSIPVSASKDTSCPLMAVENALTLTSVPVGKLRVTTATCAQTCLAPMHAFVMVPKSAFRATGMHRAQKYVDVFGIKAPTYRRCVTVTNGRSAQHVEVPPRLKVIVSHEECETISISRACM